MASWIIEFDRKFHHSANNQFDLKRRSNKHFITISNNHGSKLLVLVKTKC